MAEKDAPTHSWLMERRYFSLIIALAFVILLIVTFFLSYRHHTINTEQALKEDRSAANLLSLVLEEHLKRLVSVMESYAQRPLLLQAVRDKNAEKAEMHLISLTKSDPGIDILIITDRQGTLWANYPRRPEVLGKNFAYRDYYKGVSKEWKSYISDVFLRIVGEKDLAVTICVPFVDETGKAIGILVNTQRTVGLNYLFKQAPLDPGTTITVADRKGQIVYDSRHDVEKEMRLYPFHSGIEKAKAAKNNTLVVDDPGPGGKTRYISFAPVANIGWTVFVEREERSILLSEAAYYIQLTAIAFLLFLTVILILAYLRKQVAAQQFQEQLQAEKKIRAGEEKLLALSSRQEAILAAVPEIIMEVDNNKVYTWANSTGIEFFGEDVIGKEAALYFEGEQDTYGIVRPLFNGAEGIIYVESWQRRKDGAKRLLAWWCRVLKDESGQVTGALSSARDVTDRRQAEEEIRKLNAELEQRVLDRTAQLSAANKELEAFSYSVSHDLRAPLRSIDGFSQALLEEYQGKLDETGKTYLERVRKATQRMGLLIDDMLKLSRITQAEMKGVTVDLSALIREIAEAHQKSNPDRAVNVTVHEGIMVQGDPYLIKIAMENLVGNAWKFTGKEAHPRIEFGTAVRDGETACFIRDNGAGFDMAYVGKLFGAFQRLHTIDEFPGTGIGLATVQRIIHRHGGRVWAEGEVGKGATFYFTLPS
jgi:PAS domain S-box-containing protein